MQPNNHYVDFPLLKEKGVILALKREDLLHPFISGNKYRKLKYNLKEAQEFNQAVFDACFADMDQTLREMGAGDMSVPKHMRRMMKGFNGRMHAYEEAYDDKAAFEEVLRRNVFAGDAEADVKPLAGYVRKMIKSLTKRGAADIMNGEIILDEIN